MAVRGGVVGGGSLVNFGSNPRWSPADLCRNAHDEETFGGMKRLSGSMTTLLFPRNVRAVRLGAALGLVFTARFLAAAEAAFPAIPDAPTVPMAPTLPDAAIIREPLQPAASQEIIEERPTSQHVWVSGHWRWQEGRYAWIGGRWDLPPRANVSWVEPRWEKQGNGYVLSGGYWQESPAQGVAMNSVPASSHGVPSVPPQQAPSARQPEVIVIREAPPPPPREIIVERPSHHHVWIGGHWGSRAGRHVWVGGRWDLPPRSDVVWIEPRWERRSHGYVLIEGYWREATPVRVYERGGREVIIVREPPPPRREVVPARAVPGQIWISGYWAWHGDRHIWVGGHFERPPRARAVWVEPRWERRSSGHIFIEGFWR